jgi:hypothetical protein
LKEFLAKLEEVEQKEIDDSKVSFIAIVIIEECHEAERTKMSRDLLFLVNNTQGHILCRS